MYSAFVPCFFSEVKLKLRSFFVLFSDTYKLIRAVIPVLYPYLSYPLAELRNNYSDVDYTKLKKDSDDFHRVAELVQNAEQNKKKVKMKVAE